MLTLMLGWAAVIGLSVFILYVRDPFAAGRHRSNVEAFLTRCRGWIGSLCDNLRSRGLCPNG